LIEDLEELKEHGLIDATFLEHWRVRSDESAGAVLGSALGKDDRKRQSG